MTSTLPSRPHGPKTHDITAEFTKAALELKTGELVQDEYFTLFESVGALEIMDPKMDSGCLAEGESLEDNYDVLQELLPEEIVGVMDQLLCYEMAWHMGYPLSQTLFTSLYIDRLLWPEPKELDEARFDRHSSTKSEEGLLHLVLRSYCLALIKTCDGVAERIAGEHYYEEEDYVLSLYNRSLLSSFHTNEILELLDRAAIFLGDLDLSEHMKGALNARISFRRSFLEAVHLDETLYSKCLDLWQTSSIFLSRLTESHEAGRSVDDSFSVKLQRKLASTVPPRPIVHVNFEDASKFLGRLIQSAEDVYKSIPFFGGSTLMQTAIWVVQSRQPQPPTYIRSLTQAIIFKDMKVLGSYSVKQLIVRDLEEIVLPADILIDESNHDIEAPQDDRHQIAKRMDEFVMKVADSFIDIYRTLCMNRSRLRRMLCHLAVDWDNLQYEAEAMDTELQQYTHEVPIRGEGQVLWSFPLSSWAYYHKLKQLEWIVQMGFELDVYQPDEIGGMYWYLQHLACIRMQHVQRINIFIPKRVSQMSSPSVDHEHALRRSLAFLGFARLEAAATQAFAEGLSSLYSFLSLVGLISLPYQGMPYSNPQLRYALRMRPFLAISLPEVPSYDDFLSSVSFQSETDSLPGDTSVHALTILDVADQAFKTARKHFDALSKLSPDMDKASTNPTVGWWRADIRNVLRCVIVANIAVATARKALTSCAGDDGMLADELKRILKVTMKTDEAETIKGKNYHAWWIVPEISLV